MRHWAKPLLASVLLVLQSAAYSNQSLTIVGLGGDDNYREQFENAGSQLRPIDASVQITNATADSTTDAASDANSEASKPAASGLQYTLLIGDDVTRESIFEAIEKAAGSLTPDDQFVLTLIGHGSFDGENYRFNIPGPDITASELATSMATIVAARQLVVLATSASGAALEALDAPGRVVITATKSGGEINAVTFPTHWADALTLEAADIDHNELLTALEAFDYASQQVEAHYARENLMATEHPRLLGDDAGSIVLARLGSLKGHEDNPVVAALLVRRAALEAKFNAVKARKSELSSKAYLAELERVLLDIARLQQEMDRETGWNANNG